jgi:hypothetical protein
MGVVARNRGFLASAALIIVGGLVIMGIFTAFFAMAEEGTTSEAVPAAAIDVDNNLVGSYGMTGSADVTLQVTDETPKAIANALKEKRGMVLLVYCAGATADENMLAQVNDLKDQYVDDMSFFTYESLEVKRLGDVLGQLGVSNPPILAIVRGDGSVAEMYTGWVGAQVLEQRIADTARGI